MTIDEALNIAHLIPGWQWPRELRWMWHNFAKSSLHAEIGVWCGKSLWMAAAAMGRGRIIAIDPLGVLPIGRPWEQAVLNATIGLIHERTDVEVEHWPMLDVDGARKAHESRLSFDSTFIDSDHSYGGTLAAIQSWRPLLRSGGILSGHDYWPKDNGVMAAVNEELEQFSVAPGTRIWLTR